MNKQIVKEMIYRNKIIAIIRGVEENQVIEVVQALVDGGVRLIEFTFEHANSNCIEDNIRKIKMAKDYFADQICVGAGTVLNVEEVEKAINAGAEFIISPNANTSVIKRTNDLNKVSIPGALTPTEAVMAYVSGADFVKLFPAGELGKNYIKALMSPLGHIPFIAVGGVTPYNMKEYLEIGICGVGIGGQLISKKAVIENNYSEISRIAKEFTNNI